MAAGQVQANNDLLNTSGIEVSSSPEGEPHGNTSEPRIDRISAVYPLPDCFARQRALFPADS